jgi:2-polyprenyl-3-methyl-5-hydroxy-6-metoxy-1,4-benzoquinol methylase
MIDQQKINYLFRSAINIGQEKRCPFCKSQDLVKIDSKYFVTALLSCNNCKLSHRHPKDEEKWMQKFYQKVYNVDNQLMTTLPSDDEIVKLKEENFPALRSYATYIDALVKKDKVQIIDYGCSWGYNVYKLIHAGYKTFGYELSIPRAQFGAAKLDVPIFYDIAELPLDNDVILSSHVIEHLGNISSFIDLSKKLLKEDGIFMAFCPNGDQAYANRDRAVWHINWGNVHPNYLTVAFAQYVFKKNPYLILTGDWEFNAAEIKNWDGLSQVTGTLLAGKELLIIAKPNIPI